MTVCSTCGGEGTVERWATPEEVDAGCELGIAFDPCPTCTRRYLLLRVGAADDDARAYGLSAWQLAPGWDAYELAATVWALAPPDWHARSEWCVVVASDERAARWPNPEPWASPLAG